MADILTVYPSSLVLTMGWCSQRQIWKSSWWPTYVINSFLSKWRSSYCDDLHLLKMYFPQYKYMTIMYSYHVINSVDNNCKYMKIIYVHCRWKKGLNKNYFRPFSATSSLVFITARITSISSLVDNNTLPHYILPLMQHHSFMSNLLPSNCNHSHWGKGGS